MYVSFWFCFAAQFLFDFHLKLALKKYTIYLSINQYLGNKVNYKAIYKIKDVIFNKI